MIRCERRTTAGLSADLLAVLRTLLDTAFDGGFTDEDFQHALGGEHVVVFDGDVLITHAAVVPRTIHVGDRTLSAGYVEAVATAPSRQREGWGSRAMGVLGEVVRERYALGVLSTGRPGFYERIGWQRWQGPSSVVREGRRVRTADDDDGIMVLLHGSTADVDLTWPIVCLDRPGDAW